MDIVHLHELREQGLRQVARGEELIARQKIQLTRLRKAKLETGAARQCLRGLEDAQYKLIANLGRIEQKLALAHTDPALRATAPPCPPER